MTQHPSSASQLQTQLAGLPRADPWWQRALDLALPPRCVGCGIRGAEVCAGCIAALRPIGPACPRCSRPSPGGRVCPPCARAASPLQTILAAYPFEGALRSAILALKYRGRTRLVSFLSAALAAPLAARPIDVDVVVPVPLTTGRARARGFNQAELLARDLAAMKSWPLETDALIRVRDTGQQTRLPARERRANVAGAFAVQTPDSVRDRRVLLVDDVCTTGATLEACAAPLVAAGTAGVWAIVAAREV